MRTLEQYLRDCAEKQVIDFRIRATEISGPEGEKLVFYIHPIGKDGSTMDFAVCGNQLKTEQDSK